MGIMRDVLEESMKDFKEGFDKKIAGYFDDWIENQEHPELKEAFANLKNYVLSGGKRLRPYILNKMNQEFRKTENVDDVLLAFEFLHNSTLIDDDVIDEHDERRSNQTLPRMYGYKHHDGNFGALLNANILRGLGVDLIMKSGLPKELERDCLMAYQDIGRSIDSAQLLDLEYRGRADIGEEEYIAQTELVTSRFISYMFQLCASEKHRDSFYTIGRNLGMAFQLSDDLMDVDRTKKKGRSLGADIREGAPTLLSIYTAKRLGGREKTRFDSSFGEKDLSDSGLGWIIAQYERTGAIRDTKERLREYINHANCILEDIGMSQNHWIAAFGEYSLRRSR